MTEMKYSIFAMGIMVALISFLGFVVENLWLAVTKGYMNNRNMNMPFLLGYGLLVLLLFFALGTPEELVQWGILGKVRSRKGRYTVYFACSFIAVCIGEIILGMLVERSCGIEYWNYMNLPMHITKYTSVPTSISFAFLITFFMGKCFRPLMEWISRLDSPGLRSVSINLVIIMAVDFFYSFYRMFTTKNFYLKWQIEISSLKEKKECF